MKSRIFTALLCAASLAAPALGQSEDALKGMFLSADSNEDGVVTKDEFLARRAKSFTVFDNDQSGGLSQDEFTAALMGRAAKFSGRAFRRVDANGDGVIDNKEWNDSPTRGFDRVDQNNDGALTPDELNRR